MNEKIDVNVKTLSPFTKILMTIGELPTSYLMSMTYYEQLIWFTKYLQEQVIPAVNTNAQAVEEVQQLIMELQDYVNHYFDNLNIQEEVNNKLDEMVEDGTLLNLLSNYANLQKLYNTFDELYNDSTVTTGQKVKCFGLLEINDGNGGEFIIDENSGIPLLNGLYANPLNNYEENFYNEITFTQERYYDTDCYFTTIPLNDNDNNQIDLYMAHREYKEQTPLKYAQEKLTSFTMNGALWIDNTEDDSKSGIPVIIGNGEILHDNSMYGEAGVDDCYKYIGIKANRDIAEYQVNTTTPQQLIADGCKNVFNCFFKLINNYVPTDLTDEAVLLPSIVNDRHPRQVFCEMQDKSIMILTTDGRDEVSRGLTCAQLQDILVEKEVKNAWNLDGGGSTSTEIKTIKINKNIDNGYTEDREIAYTLNSKKVIKNKNIANVYAYMSNMFHFFNKRYQDERIRMHNSAGKNANTIIGELYFGMGTSMTNTPNPSGYIINLTDCILPENKYLYNKQIFYGTTTYKVYTRQMVNGEWTPWIINSAPISRITFSQKTLTADGYAPLIVSNVANFDGDSIIKNEDGTFSFTDISTKLLHITLRASGSTGDKFIRLVKNGTDVTYASNYNPDDTNKYQISMTALLNITNTTDKFKVEVSGKTDDIFDLIFCYIK